MKYILYVLAITPALSQSWLITGNPGDPYKVGSGGGGSVAFSSVTAGTNGTSLVIGTGGSLTTSGSGSIVATNAATVYNATKNGMVCDNSTDDTAAFNTLLATVNTAGGGTVFLPSMCKISGGDIVFPNNGATPPAQSYIRITGLGNIADQLGNTTFPTPSSGLNLTAIATVAQLDTRGNGILEIDHLTLKNTAANCSDFIHTTNTVLKIHDVTFTKTQKCGKAIVLGGTNPGITNGTSDSQFQGYGTVIRDNYFDQLSSIVKWQASANGVQVLNNVSTPTVGCTACGTAPYDLTATFNQMSGNYIAGNVVETSVTKYAFACNASCIGNRFEGNSTFDSSTPSEAAYDLTGSSGNIVITGFDGPPTPIGSWVQVNGAGTANTVIASASQLATPQSLASYARFGSLSLLSAGVASTPPALISGAWFTGGSTTTTKPSVLIEPAGTTSNNWQTVGSGLGINAPSGFSSVGYLIDAQINGSQKFAVKNTGIIFGGAESGVSAGTVGGFLGLTGLFFSNNAAGGSTTVGPISGIAGGLHITNSAETDFTRVSFGPDTTSFPAVCHSGTTFKIMLGGACTTDAPFSASNAALSGTATKYNNVSTAGWGVPAIYGSGRQTAQTAADASIAAYTVGAADGSFEISANVQVTTATAHTFTVICTYTDETNMSRTLTLTFSQITGTMLTAITNVTGAGAYEGVPLHIRAKAGTSITLSTTGTFTTCVYNVEGSIRQIA